LIRRVLLIAFLGACALTASSSGAQQGAAASPAGFNQLLQAAEKARDENRNAEAMRLFRRALSEQPESEQALWYLSTMLYEEGQYAAARDRLRQFMTLRPDAGPGWAFLGMSEFQLREYSHALDHLQRALAQGVGDRKELVNAVYYELAVLLTRFERYDDSMDMLLKMLASGNTDPVLAEPAGLAGLRLPLLPAEIPSDRRELVDLAGQAVLALQTQHDEAADTQFKRLILAYPKEPGVHFLYGAYLAQLHPDEAVPQFERELEISPCHVLARVRLADLLIARREFDRALVLAQQAIKLDPKRASAHMLAGEALIGRGDTAEGLKELEAARAEDPAMTRIHWDLLRAYATAGRKHDAELEQQEMEKLYRAQSPGARNRLGDAPHGEDSPK
jgi:tetratricopeptide (TPR) repeat protein